MYLAACDELAGVFRVDEEVQESIEMSQISQAQGTKKLAQKSKNKIKFMDLPLIARVRAEDHWTFDHAAM